MNKVKMPEFVLIVKPREDFQTFPWQAVVPELDKIFSGESPKEAMGEALAFIKQYARDGNDTSFRLQGIDKQIRELQAERDELSQQLASREVIRAGELLDQPGIYYRALRPLTEDTPTEKRYQDIGSIGFVVKPGGTIYGTNCAWFWGFGDIDLGDL